MSSTVSRAVLVTGCGAGIGRATARRLAGAGFTVYATARRREAIADLEAAGCRLLVLDVDDEESRQAAVAAVERDCGAVFALVNNAGYSQSGAIEEIPLDRVRAQFETNVFSVVRLSQLVLPGMRREGRGRIVNIGSMGGVLTFPGGGVYHATKHALEALADALRFEVGGFGVKVVLVQPGLIRSEFAATAGVHLAGLPATGPYAAFNAHVGRATVEAYEKGPLAALGGPPEAVARVVEKALTARSPRARYKVTASAHVMMRLRSALPDAAWDAFLRSQFPQPGRS